MKSWMDAIQSKAFYNRETVTVVNISSVEGHWTHTVSQLIGFCPVPVCYYGWDGACPHLWLGVGLACLSWVPLKTSLPIFGCAWSAWDRIFCPLLLKLATSMEPIGELCAEANNKSRFTLVRGTGLFEWVKQTHGTYLNQLNKFWVCLISCLIMSFLKCAPFFKIKENIQFILFIIKENNKFILLPEKFLDSNNHLMS